MPEVHAESGTGKRKQPGADAGGPELSKPPPKKGRSEPAAENGSLKLPHESIIGELAPKYNVLPTSILSSTPIGKRVKHAIKHLLDRPDESRVVLFYARPKDVCKLITVVEQCRRTLKRESKQCFQYNQLFVLPKKSEPPEVVEETKIPENDSESDSDDFEVMDSRFEKAVLPTPPAREAKSMRVFLALSSIPELKSKDGVTLQVDE